MRPGWRWNCDDTWTRQYHWRLAVSRARRCAVITKQGHCLWETADSGYRYRWCVPRVHCWWREIAVKGPCLRRRSTWSSYSLIYLWHSVLKTAIITWQATYIDWRMPTIIIISCIWALSARKASVWASLIHPWATNYSTPTFWTPMPRSFLAPPFTRQLSVAHNAFVLWQ